MDNSQSIEIEARFINLDQKIIEKKLEEIGARKISESFFKEWIFWHKNKEWMEKNRRIRIRDSGEKVWLTYKAQPTWGIDTTEEVEVTVSSADEAKKLVEKIGVPFQRYQEKKRIQYKLGDTSIDLDFWPKIPMVLEIEALSKEEVMRAANLLELKGKDAIFGLRELSCWSQQSKTFEKSNVFDCFD